MTGRAGYFKRTTANDTTSSLRVLVHDSDDSIAAAPDLHNRVFTKTSKAINQGPDPIDCLELPFFQMGNLPTSLRYNMGTATGTVGSHPVPIQSPTASCPMPIQNADAARTDDVMNSDSEHEKELAQQSLLNPFQVMHHAIPSHARTLAQAKASAKSQAKAAAAKTRPSNTATAGGKKRKSQKDEKDDEPQAKILRLNNSDKDKGVVTKPDKTGQSQNAASAQADDVLMADFTEELTTLKKKVLANPRDTDAAITETLKAAHKELNVLTKKLRSKVKSLKRRADQGVSLTTQMESMIEELSKACTICSAMLNSQADTGLPSSLKELDDWEWHVSAAMYKRAFKCGTLGYLRNADWVGFTGSRDQMCALMDFSNGNYVFELMVSEMIQRLLKALPAKVSCQ